MVKEAEDLHKNHSQRGVTSPAYLRTQTEIKGLTLHNAQNSWMHYSLTVQVNWLQIDMILRQKFSALRIRSTWIRLDIMVVIPSENLCINDFIISGNKLCIPVAHISRLCIFSTKPAIVISVWRAWFNKTTYSEYLCHFLLLWYRAVVLYGQDDGVGWGHKGTPVNGLHHCLRTHRQNH